MSGVREDPWVALSPSATVLLRGDSTLQFGLNSGSAGVFSHEHLKAETVARVFAQCIYPTTISQLRSRLQAAEIEPTLCDLLIDDLLNHGVLVPSRRVAVGLIGMSPLAMTIMRVLSEMGVVVLRPDHTSSEAFFIEQLPFDTPVIVAGKMETKRNLIQVLQTWPEVMPVNTVDGIGVIGPVRTQRRGPCLQCADLYHVQRDPLWVNLMAQVPLQPRPNPVVEYATTARLASLLQPRYPAPGLVNEGVKPGLVIEVNPFSGTSTETVMQPHPICPVCWEKWKTS